MFTSPAPPASLSTLSHDYLGNLKLLSAIYTFSSTSAQLGASDQQDLVSTSPAITHWPLLIPYIQHNTASTPAVAEMARRFSKPVPHIKPTLPPEEDLFFDGPQPDISEFGIGGEQEPSDDEDEDEIMPIVEINERSSACQLVNYQEFVPERRAIGRTTENEELKALLQFCPHVLTYMDSKCPLGEDCTLKQICYNNSRLNGCRREGCKFSHEYVATCRRLLKHGHCRRKNCTLNHDFELRNTIREAIPDHVEFRIFGVKNSIMTQTYSDGEAEVVAAQNKSNGETEEIVPQDEVSVASHLG